MNNLIQILNSFEDIEPYINHVCEGADGERNSLGFLPQIAYRHAAEQGKLFIATNSTGLFRGHLMFGGMFPNGKVIQIYTCPEYRNQGVARTLLEGLVRYTQKRNYISLSAKVASDLPHANAFYESMGLHVVRKLPGGATRNRVLHLRVRDLNTPNLFDLMAPSRTEHISSLYISDSFSTIAPIYAIDLNVLFDVSKKRVRSDEAGLIFGAGFKNDIRLVIAEEFIEELRRSEKKYPNDPHIKLALHIPVLSTPKPQTTKKTEDQLAAKIFPERYSQKILTVQDRSDIRHLATAIHNKISGFITSENAILRAHDYLQSEFGLDVLGVSDFADAQHTDDIVPGLDKVTLTNDSELSSSSLNDEILGEVISFLRSLKVSEKVINSTTSRGDCISPQNHILLTENKELVSFASWTATQNPRKLASIFLFVDESSPAATTAIDYLLDQISNTVSAGASSLLCLNILPGHPLTRKIAFAHGFRCDPSQMDHGTILNKIAVGNVITDHSWSNTRNSIKHLAGAELPIDMPNYEGHNQSIQVTTSYLDDKQIPLHDLEILLSPTLILLPGRPGAVVSIRRVYADELLGTAEQLSLLTPPEAVFLKERVYYNTPQAASILVPGTPILFYESSHSGGRKSIIAVGRITASIVLNVDQLDSTTQRKGVLDKKSLKCVGAGDKKLATTFDNIMAFKKPVPLDTLRKIGCVDGANFVTAKRIEHDQLVKIINIGMMDE